MGEKNLPDSSATTLLHVIFYIETHNIGKMPAKDKSMTY